MTLKTANTAQDGSWDALGHALGCGWGFWGALGAFRSGMLQPPWHVTAALAFYKTLFSYPSIFPSTHLSPKSYVLGAKS